MQRFDILVVYKIPLGQFLIIIIGQVGNLSLNVLILLGSCLKGDWKVSGRHREDVWKVYDRSIRGVWKVSERGLEDDTG